MTIKLHDKLFALRTGRKISQDQVAQAIGVSRVAYTRYENGTRKPGSRTTVRLARYFGVPVEYLVDDGSEPELNEAPAVNDSGLDEELISLLLRLSPPEVQRVKDFVAGLIASREA